MRRKTKLVMAGAAFAAAAALGTGIAVASGVGGDDGESPITGTALERASSAALAHTGGGTVSDTEVGDEESQYEVEVTLGDGRQVDVQLDQDFRVVATSADEDTSEDGDSGSDGKDEDEAK